MHLSEKSIKYEEYYLYASIEYNFAFRGFVDSISNYVEYMESKEHNQS